VLSLALADVARRHGEGVSGSVRPVPSAPGGPEGGGRPMPLRAAADGVVSNVFDSTYVHAWASGVLQAAAPPVATVARRPPAAPQPEPAEVPVPLLYQGMLTPPSGVPVGMVEHEPTGEVWLWPVGRHWRGLQVRSLEPARLVLANAAGGETALKLGERTVVRVRNHD
jgi:hypothetical protein